jgi:hypothetical protein
VGCRRARGAVAGVEDEVGLEAEARGAGGSAQGGEGAASWLRGDFVSAHGLGSVSGGVEFLIV